jgi:hypothetical protein
VRYDPSDPRRACIDWDVAEEREDAVQSTMRTWSLQPAPIDVGLPELPH